jgi:hypothetical protein
LPSSRSESDRSERFDQLGNSENGSDRSQRFARLGNSESTMNKETAETAEVFLFVQALQWNTVSSSNDEPINWKERGELNTRRVKTR